MEGGRRRGRQRDRSEDCGKRGLDEGEEFGELGIWGVEGGRRRGRQRDRSEYCGKRGLDEGKGVEN